MQSAMPQALAWQLLAEKDAVVFKQLPVLSAGYVP
jgi:hypothetical protein